MGVTTISLTEAKRSLGEVVNRVAYGGERIILLAEARNGSQSLPNLREGEQCRVANTIEAEPCSDRWPSAAC